MIDFGATTKTLSSKRLFLGFGCYWIWVFTLFDSGFTIADVQGIALPLCLHIVSLATSSLAFLLAVVFHHRLGGLVWRRPFVTANVVLAVVSTILCLFPVAALQPQLTLIGGTFNGIASMWFSVSWGLLFARQRPHGALLLIVMSFFSATLVALVLPLVPTGFLMVFGCVAALTSATLACKGNAELLQDARPQLAAAGVVTHRSAHLARLIPVKVAVGLIVVVFVYAIGRSIIFQNPSFSFDMHQAMLVATSVIVVAVFFFCGAAVDLGVVYKVAILCVAVASVFIAFSYADFVMLAASLEAASICFIEAATWVLIVDLARRNPGSALATIALGRLFVHFGSAVGEVTGLLLVGQQNAFLFIAIVALVVAAGFFFVGGESTVAIDDKSVQREMDQSEMGDCGLAREEQLVAMPPERVARTLLRAGLSERECEVARLWVGGARGSDIEARLFISKSTVKTHLKHVYEKTGAHSKQELIEFVQKSGSDE